MERTMETAPSTRTCFVKFARKYTEELGALSTHFIEGYATTGDYEDTFGIRLSTAATRGAMVEYDQWRNVRFMHQDNPVGVVRDWRVDDKGLFVRVQVMDEEVWEKIEAGLVTGFSIGFGFQWTDALLDQWIEGETITPNEYWLTEISIVDRPADTACSFNIVRRAEGANTGTANTSEIAKVVRDTIAEFFRTVFKTKPEKGGEELDKEKEANLTAEVERLTAAQQDAERALADAKAELAERDKAAEEAKRAAAVEFVRGLSDENLVQPADAEKWVARRLANPEWAEEHAALLRSHVPEAKRGLTGRPSDHVPSPDGESSVIAERAKELQKENPKLPWGDAVNMAARELQEGAH